MTLRRLRLVLVLLPASLLVHELAYMLASGGLTSAHGYLELLLPVSVALAATVALATLVAPALGAPGSGPQPIAPFALAIALLGVFVAQELAEAVLLGGGAAGFAASVSVAWLAPPLALLLGALSAGLIVALERTALLLATPKQPRAAATHRTRSLRCPSSPDLALPAAANLGFGFARRPPPARA